MNKINKMFPFAGTGREYLESQMLISAVVGYQTNLKKVIG